MKKRLISAIIAIAIIVPFLIIGGYCFSFLIGIISILAYKEVLDLKKSHGNIPWLVKIFGLISLLYIVIGDIDSSSLDIIIGYSRFILPLLIMLTPTIFYGKKYTTKDAFYMLGFIYLLGFLFNMLIIIRNINIYIFVYLLCITIFTDTFAYLVGSIIGKHKMALKLSPNKTWEGAIGGMIGGSLIASVVYFNLIDAFSFKVLLVTIILSIFGQMGDLFYSKIKRENDIKDFSNIMPGHGGILDRVDSLSFVVIAYVLLISLF